MNTDPQFDNDALACFRETFGPDITAEFRDTVAEGGFMALIQVCASLGLSTNDRDIFYGAARALQREAVPA